MDENKKWRLELEEYIRQGEPTQMEKSSAWNTAIGLQDVDGLETSDYLLETAKEHIEGKIDISAAHRRINRYYEEQNSRAEMDTEEADKVSVRIAELLGEKTFQFSPAEWMTIHRRLFDGILDYAGRIRPYNITKKEWILNEDTVLYASRDSIHATMDYDFKMEKQFSYEGLSTGEVVKHIARFTSDIWQIHPFCEGNTRATAVFIIKYLRTFGFDVSNDVFADHSWYFRNALVRANYNNFTKGIHATTEYLVKFFENLLMDGKHELKNRYLHVNYDMWEASKEIQSVVREGSKYHSDTLSNGFSDTLNCTLEEVALLKAIQKNPLSTQKQLAEEIGKSESTIKRYTVKLQQKGYLKRINGKRDGRWQVLVELPGMKLHVPSVL